MRNINKVSIKFKSGAYGAYRNMQNKVWYALAEFVDNALQSYLDNKNRILEINGEDFQFSVELEINKDQNLIRIIDNAAGIDADNFIRAFEPANIPPDASGLSEFGMGMKIASIWLADKYELKSSAIDEKVERSVTFDLGKVMREEKEDLAVKNKKLNEHSHYTILELKDLSNNAPSNRNLSKIKKHLTSIYRKFLASGELELIINGEPQKYIKPKVLKAPKVGEPESETIVWEKTFDFNYKKKKISGTIGLLNEMSTSKNGFSLFRRGRVIEGSHDERYCPKVLSGNIGSPRYKRIFGDIELEGFDVSFDKGKFIEVDELDAVLRLIKDELSQKDFNLIKQGNDFRKSISAAKKKKVINKTIEVENTKVDNEEINKDLDKNIGQILVKSSTGQKNPTKVKKQNLRKGYSKEFKHGNKDFKLEISFIERPERDLLTLLEQDKNTYNGIINLSHSYFDNYQLSSEKDYEKVLAIFKALLFAELLARLKGANKEHLVRSNLNTILKNKL